MNNRVLSTLAFTGIITLLIASAYYAWSVHVAGQVDLMNSLASEIATKNQDAERIQEVKSALNELSRTEDTIASHFIASKDIVTVLESLAATGKGLGTKVSVVSVSADKTPPGGHVVLALSITGSFAAVMRTVDAFENAPTDVVVSSLTLDTTGGGVWTAATTLTMGVRPEQPSPSHI